MYKVLIMKENEMYTYFPCPFSSVLGDFYCTKFLLEHFIPLRKFPEKNYTKNNFLQLSFNINVKRYITINRVKMLYVNS